MQWISFIEAYLLSSEHRRREAKSKFEVKAIKDIVKVLDTCTSYRSMHEVIRIAGEMDTKEENGIDKFKLFNEIQKVDRESLFQMWKAYNCGYLMGVRHERSRRKGNDRNEN